MARRQFVPFSCFWVCFLLFQWVIFRIDFWNHVTILLLWVIELREVVRRSIRFRLLNCILIKPRIYSMTISSIIDIWNLEEAWIVMRNVEVILSFHSSWDRSIRSIVRFTSLYSRRQLWQAVLEPLHLFAQFQISKLAWNVKRSIVADTLSLRRPLLLLVILLHHLLVLRSYPECIRALFVL